MKTALKKIVTPHPMTFEHLFTVLTEVEAILNSRPLIPLDSTSSDGPSVLTAGHFLIGRPLKSLPLPETNNNPLPLLKHWNLVQHLQQNLWKTWKSRYLQSLSARQKCTKVQRNFREGDIVLLKDESIPHRTWPLAKVMKTFPGSDGLTRVVELLCQGHTYKRSTDRLILLVSDQLPPGSMSGTCQTGDSVNSPDYPQRPLAAQPLNLPKPAPPPRRSRRLQS